MLLRYGDHHRLSHHAVLAFDQLVGEAPRPLVADEDGTVFPSTLLALASSEEGATLVSTLKVLAILTSLRSSKANALRVIPYVSLARDTTPPASPRSLGTMMKVAPQAVSGEAICWLVGIITRSSQVETAPLLTYLVTPQSVPWYNAGGYGRGHRREHSFMANIHAIAAGHLGWT